MGLSVSTNTASLKAQMNLRRNSASMENTVARLSSGLRINKAADDAAGLAISEGLKAQMRGLGMVQRNASDGISLLQTAEGVLNSVHAMLSRMRELALQSANGTYGTSERAYLDDEFQRLTQEIDRIAETTEFNGQKLLNGALSDGISFQVGLNSVSDDRITVSIADAHANALGYFDTNGATPGGSTWLNNQDVASIDGALQALTSIDQAIADTSRIRGKLGAAQNRLEYTIDNIQIMRSNITAANSRIRDADVAAEASEMARVNILTQAATAMVGQANQLPQMALQLLQ